MTNDLHYLELVDIGQRIQKKELSPVEVTQAQLDRIGKVDGALKSYVTVMAEQAMADARKAEAEIAKGEIRGPLHGVPVAVKDLCWTEGVATAAGMTLYKDFVPTEDGTAVRKLREAGAVILGKLQLTESAYADHHPTVTPPVNPWNAAHWSGATRVDRSASPRPPTGSPASSRPGAASAATARSSSPPRLTTSVR